jgi:hypothetical protein
MIESTDSELLRSGVANADDVVAIVAGTRMATPGSTNFIRLHRIRPLREAGRRSARTTKTTTKDTD